MAADWRPDASLPLLQARAQVLAGARQFFAGRGVLEVETPLVSQATATEPDIEPMRVGHRYLQTSPEYAMKRLLAAGSGPIYQICKAFRGSEAGARHNPEFTLLEWYRPGFGQQQMMDEVRQLVELFLPGRAWSSISYRQLFQQHLALDPWEADVRELEACARAAVEVAFPAASRDQWLDLLLSHLLEPRLAEAGMVFVYDFPPSQAALSRLKKVQDITVSDRFELYAEGVELANAYCELTDATEQAERFQRDIRELERRAFATRSVDERLLSALQHGMPDCSGVALGLDRLLMLAQGCENISDVLAFAWPRA